jgi:hypothetical protein
MKLGMNIANVIVDVPVFILYHQQNRHDNHANV